MGPIVRYIVEGLDSFVYEWGVLGVWAVGLWVGAIILVAMTIAHA